MPENDSDARHSREALRQRFRPARVRLLFVGESPPASGRFFYARDSGLYRAMREAFQAADAPIRDDAFLTAFQASGCYLIDLCANPVDRLDPKSRLAARAAGEESLAETIAEFQPAAIGILLQSIGPNVAKAISRAGWDGESIQLPYPGRWVRHRNAFVDTLAPFIGRVL